VTDLRLQAGWQEGDRKTESSVDLPPLQNDTGLAIPAAQLQESAFLAPVFWGPGGSAYYRNYDFLPEINPDTKVSRHWDAILQTPQIPPGQAGQATYLVQMPLADKEVSYVALYLACPGSEDGIVIDLRHFLNSNARERVVKANGSVSHSQ
jgi:hypothetical protein